MSHTPPFFSATKKRPSLCCTFTPAMRSRHSGTGSSSAEADVSRLATEELSKSRRCVYSSAAMQPSDHMSMRSSTSVPRMISGAR